MRVYKLTILFLMLLVLFGCSQKKDTRYDTNDAVPAGEPAFPKLETSWVIDQAGVLDSKTIETCSKTCQKLQNDGVAEVVVLVINGVKGNPVTYATMFGRHIGLGKQGMASKGGQNGFVWIIRPDVETNRMAYSLGRGLPEFTTADAGEIMDFVKDYIYYNNFNEGVKTIVKMTDERLRKIYGKNERSQ